jgi:hypothetical protein
VTAAGYRHYLGGFRLSPDQRAILSSYVYPWLAPGLLAAALWPFVAGGQSRGTRLPLAAVAFLLPAVAAARGPVRRFARPLVAIAGLCLGLAAWSWNGAALERRTMYGELDGFPRTMWQAVPIQRGYVLWDDDMSYRLVQYQRLEHEKPGLAVARPLLLMDAGTRALFAGRHGFNPLGGANPPGAAEADSPERIQEFAQQIGEGINRGSPDSVILFLPREPSLRLLSKPAITSK